MTDEAPPVLADYIAAQYRSRVGRKPNPAHLGYLAAFAARLELLVEARNEMAVLAPTNDPRDPSQRDAERRARYETLKGMIETYEGQA